MPKRYLLFAQLPYAYTIMRPLQAEILRRGDECAWYLDEGCADLLTPSERRLHTIDEVLAYDPLAVFTPGNYIPDFFPGIKVDLFHGYPINKRSTEVDTFFALRGWFDIYCTQGPNSTPRFKQLESRHGYFRVYETGWCRADEFAPLRGRGPESLSGRRPRVFYASTFTRSLSSAWTLLPVIRRLAETRPWDWVITLHPKIDDPVLLDGYRRMAAELPNVTFVRDNQGAATYGECDVMLCDSSSIIVEFMMLDRPVVTYRNSQPGPHVIDVLDADAIAPAIERALQCPDELMQAMRAYLAEREAHIDGHNSARVLDAVDDFRARWQGRLPRKPLNLWRKLKLRRRMHYWRLPFRYSPGAMPVF